MTVMIGAITEGAENIMTKRILARLLSAKTCPRQ